MPHARSLFFVAISVLAIAACASREEIARKSAIPAYPNPYRAALQTEFLALADREAAQNDHIDAKIFLDRAEAAARALDIRPAAIDAYDIPEDRQAGVRNARKALLRLLDGGRARAPASAARAHAMYECWLEELEEGHQQEDIAWCRRQFEDAVAATRRDAGLDADWGMVLQGDGGHVGAITIGGRSGDGRLLDRAEAAGFVHAAGDARDAVLTRRENDRLTALAMAFLPLPPKVYVVYFGSGAASLTAEALLAVNAAAADAADRPAPDVEILGFADRAGDDAANLALSRRRATAVKAALAAAGVPGDAFLVYPRGEATPAVDTPDGVPDRRNRRVEITVR